MPEEFLDDEVYIHSDSAQLDHEYTGKVVLKPLSGQGTEVH